MHVGMTLTCNCEINALWVKNTFNIRIHFYIFTKKRLTNIFKTHLSLFAVPENVAQFLIASSTRSKSFDIPSIVYEVVLFCLCYVNNHFFFQNIMHVTHIYLFRNTANT